jgi:hypothetical protein
LQIMMRYSRLHRLGRQLLWPHPQLYRWVGLLRNRGDCVKRDIDVWIGGYPRSSNSFAAAAFALSNPGVRVARHWHIPAFIIHAVRSGTPGIFLVREPANSVVSWTIFWQGRWNLEDALDYYVDFHRALLPYRLQLFIASFEEVTNRFDLVVQNCNARFGTSFAALAPSDCTSDRCFSLVEDWFRGPDGSVDELVVARPSDHRAGLKAKLVEDLRNSPKLARKLAAAEQMYSNFSGERKNSASQNGGLLPALNCIQPESR